MSKTINGLTAKVLTIIITVGVLFTAAWALDDRMDDKIKTLEERTMYDSKSIREMEKTLVRIEGRFKILDERLKNCKTDR